MEIYDLALALTKNLGPKTAIHLIECFGSAKSIFEATKEELERVAKLNSAIADAIVKREGWSEAEKESKFAAKNGIEIIAATDRNYPVLLKESNDYPHIIYVKGDIEALNKRTIAIVGTRKMSEYGRKVCDRLIERLSEITTDIAIVSGLASGIDGCAHRSAIANGITTIAILPSPINVITPVEHSMLANEILAKGGCLISEYPSSVSMKSFMFVARNRIIAGVSEGTLVVESPYNGGALLTAGMADGYGRSVMAIPGRIFDSASHGTNHIIKSLQAKPICSARDIVNELGWDEQKKSVKKEEIKAILSPESLTVLESIKEGETVSIDLLTNITGFTSSELASIILELEFDGYVKRLPGNTYERE